MMLIASDECDGHAAVNRYCKTKQETLLLSIARGDTPRTKDYVLYTDAML